MTKLSLAWCAKLQLEYVDPAASTASIKDDAESKVSSLSRMHHRYPWYRRWSMSRRHLWLCFGGKEGLGLLEGGDQGGAGGHEGDVAGDEAIVAGDGEDDGHHEDDHQHGGALALHHADPQQRSDAKRGGESTPPQQRPTAARAQALQHQTPAPHGLYHSKPLSRTGWHGLHYSSD